MKQPVMRILFPRGEIAARISDMAKQIDHDYQGQEIFMIGILKGSFLFIADLIREVQTPSIVDFMRIASYGSETQSSGIIEFRKDLELSIKGRHVLIVEDIVDSGQTLSALLERLRQRDPASLRVCTLVDKRTARVSDVQVDYAGFPMDDGFIVGYGLDWDEKYRDLADIFLVDQHSGETE